MLKRYLPKSLYARVVLIVILPIFLMQSFVTYVFFERHWDLVSANLAANTAGQIALVTRLYRGADDAFARRAIEADALEDLDISVRFEPGGNIPISRNKTTPFTRYASTLSRSLDASLEEPFWFDTRSWPAYVEIRVQIDDGYLVYLPRRDRVFATNGPIFVLWLVGATLLLGWIAIVFLRNQVRSITRLAEAAEAFGRGRDKPGFRPSGATEVRRAGRAFIAMRERIKRHMHQRNAMLAGFSHDLRTPLTRIKLALAMQPDTPDIEALRADVAEMERMVDAYLTFARDISASETPELIDLSELVGGVSAEARRAGHTIGTEIEEGLAAVGRRDALRRAVANLVENARKYASNAWLTAKRAGDFAEIVVDDDGPGIAPAQYEEAFKPFVRLTPGKETGGVGLGLAIVREVARGHGGEASLQPSPRGGLRAVLRVPVEPAAAQPAVVSGRTREASARPAIQQADADV
jgi:two-component system osmolarity sensor histidine kinase EnvZ